MRFVSAADLARVLDYAALTEALRAMFRSDCVAPTRHHHVIARPDGPDGVLLLMPAWRADGAIGVKTVTVFPGNGAKGLPAVMGSYALLDGATGAPRALLEGRELTARRTAAASALAADYLARADSRRLLMVGTGAMAPHLVQAHAALRPITEVAIWGRSSAKAAALAQQLDESRLVVRPAEDLDAAVRAADIISCATLAREPLVLGRWLRPGQHLDLVGAFNPEMRESDDEAMRRSRLYVDTRDGVLAEGGDVIQAIAAGAIEAADIVGDLFDLTRGRLAGRTDNEEITVFKSTGTALEDLAAAELALARLEEEAESAPADAAP